MNSRPRNHSRLHSQSLTPTYTLSSLLNHYLEGRKLYLKQRQQEWLWTVWCGFLLCFRVHCVCSVVIFILSTLLK